jgi:hypothetical protein
MLMGMQVSLAQAGAGVAVAVQVCDMVISEGAPQLKLLQASQLGKLSLIGELVITQSVGLIQAPLVELPAKWLCFADLAGG